MNNAHVKLPQSHTENANCTNGNGRIPAKLAGAHGLVVLEFDRDYSTRSAIGKDCGIAEK